MSPSRMVGLARGVLFSRYSIPAAAVVSAAITLLLLPPGKKNAGLADPIADANVTYSVLMAQLEASGNNVQAWDSRPADEASMQEPLAPEREIERDIFSPLSREAPRSRPAELESGPPLAPRVPRLTGVFIDGARRQAAIGGALVSEGDLVSGFAVREIGTSWVVIERNGVTYRLSIGNSS